MIPHLALAGTHKLRYELGPAGELSIWADGQLQGGGPVKRLPHVMAGGGETFDTGRDSNDPVTLDYTDEGVFTGIIHRIEMAVSILQRAGQGGGS